MTDWQNARRTFLTALTWVAVAALALMLWRIRVAILLAFGAITVAILLRVMATSIAKVLRISDRLGLALATSVVLAVVGVTVWLFGSQMTSQFNELLNNIQAGEKYLTSTLQQDGFQSFGSQLAEQGTSFLTSSIGGMVSGGLRFFEAIGVVAISAIYLAAQPELYRHGIALLFPPRLRRRVVNSIDLIGRTLKLWLLGQLILMLLVGILSFIAVWLIGLPSPVALGLLAGIAEIVPYLGPFISAIPAILVALTLGLWPALWTAGAYLLIHLFEGYVTAPLIERRFVTIPPALILGGIVAIDLLFGTIGIVLAAPITVAVYMLVKMAYVDDPLEENVEQDHSRS